MSHKNAQQVMSAATLQERKPLTREFISSFAAALTEKRLELQQETKGWPYQGMLLEFFDQEVESSIKGAVSCMAWEHASKVRNEVENGR